LILGYSGTLSINDFLPPDFYFSTKTYENYALEAFFFTSIVSGHFGNLLAQQQTADIGLFGGGAVPISDYSKLKIGQSVNLNYGGFYRYNFNSRYSLRINALYGKVGASGYLDNEQSLISFNKSVVDLGAYFEINY
jgi:hypothetical protein